VNVARRDLLATLGLSALALALPATAAAQSDSPGAIRIGVVPVDVCFEVFYAAESGIFEKAGIDARLVEFGNPGAVAAGLVGDAIDVGLYDVAGLIAAHSHNIPLVYLAAAKLFNDDNPAIASVVAADSPIRGAKDFAGTIERKTVDGAVLVEPFITLAVDRGLRAFSPGPASLQTMSSAVGQRIAPGPMCIPRSR
jgi:ABC-type nitrate/sulfonate/bicarbonate transport system substrate-binding protein